MSYTIQPEGATTGVLASRRLMFAAAVLGLHLAGLGLPFVNQESAFNHAAAYFQTGDPAAIRSYFEADANPLTIPFLGAVLSAALRIGPDDGCRLLSVLVSACFALAVYSIAERERCAGGWALKILIVANPLMWIFAGRGTADFLPMATAVCAIALFWRAAPDRLAVCSAALVFAAATVMKYHAVLLLPLVMLGPDPAQSVRQRMIMAVAAASAAAVVLIVYNVAVFNAFGFWLTSPTWAHELRLTLTGATTNFIRYGGYLALLALPLSARAAFLPSGLGAASKAAAVAAGFGGGLLLGKAPGEMNLGPFDRLIGEGFSGAVLAMCFVLFVLGLLQTDRSRTLDLGRAGAIVVFIAVLSFSRPAQRYLILILPFYYLLLAGLTDPRKWFRPVLIGLVGLNLLAALAQARSVPGNAAAFGQDRFK